MDPINVQRNMENKKKKKTKALLTSTRMWAMAPLLWKGGYVGGSGYLKKEDPEEGGHDEIILAPQVRSSRR